MHAEPPDKPLIPAFDNGVRLGGKTIFQKI
jgi:hypothetical protein